MNFFKKLFNKIFQRKEKSKKMYKVQAAQPQQMHDPYCIQITNTTDEKKNCSIFGSNYNLFKPNSGLPEGVTAVNLQGSTYEHLLAQLMTNPVIISKWRIQSSDGKNLSGQVSLQDFNASGLCYSRPFKFFMDSYQYQSTIIDKSEDLILDGDTSLIIDVAPQSSIVITIFPSYVTTSWLRRNVKRLFSISRRPIKFTDRPEPPMVVLQNSVLAAVKSKSIFKKIRDKIKAWIWKEDISTASDRDRIIKRGMSFGELDNSTLSNKDENDTNNENLPSD